MKRMIVILFFVGYGAVYGQTWKQDLYTKYTTTGFKAYSIGKIPKDTAFEKINKYDFQLNEQSEDFDNRDNAKFKKDSLEITNNLNYSIKQKNEKIDSIKSLFLFEFKNNRAIGNFSLFINNQRDSQWSEGITAFPYYCTCSLKNDTLSLSSTIQWMIPFGFNINVANDRFISLLFGEKAHDEFIYKFSLKDTALSQHYFVKNLKQELTLKNNPTFRIGEIVEGSLDFETDKYYRLADYRKTKLPWDMNKFDELYYKGNFIFRCRVRHPRFF